MGKFGFVLRNLKKSSAQARKALIEAGIITTEGELTAHYLPRTKKRKAAKA